MSIVKIVEAELMPELNVLITAPARAAKLQLMLRVPGLIEEVMLSGDSKAEEFIQNVLFDLRFHPEVSLSLSTHEHKGEARLRFEARTTNGAREH